MASTRYPLGFSHPEPKIKALKSSDYLSLGKVTKTIEFICKLLSISVGKDQDANKQEK